jgi:hypothetical protein
MEASLGLFGIESFEEWDVLVFLYRHHSSLAGADQFARLLGYDTKAVIDAIHVLESSGLVKRSRISQGIRLYEVSVPEESPKRDAFYQLMSWGTTRAGRLRIRNGLKFSSKAGRDNVRLLVDQREGAQSG